jgi:hypothetical protein
MMEGTFGLIGAGIEAVVGLKVLDMTVNAVSNVGRTARRRRLTVKRTKRRTPHRIIKKVSRKRR